ncbi:MAG: phasin family protein [Pseudomonadota bacterium]
MATTKKSGKTSKKTSTTKVETHEDEKSVESIFARIQSGFKDAGAALSETGSIADEKRRDILMTLISNAQENTDATFEAMREVMTADSLSDSLRIQRDALREGIERNVAQVRDVASMTSTGTRESMEPVADYLSSLRERVRNGASA